MGITIIEHEDLFFGGGISTEEPDLAMFRYKKTKSYLWKWWLHKVGLKHSILMIFFLITFIIFICRFSKGMPSSFRIESISKSTSIIITDLSITTKAALSNVWSSKTEKTGDWDSDRTDHQSANSIVVIDESRTTGELDIR